MELYANVCKSCVVCAHEEDDMKQNWWVGRSKSCLIVFFCSFLQATFIHNKNGWAIFQPVGFGVLSE